MLKSTDEGTRGSLVTPRPRSTRPATIRVGMKSPEMYVEERNDGYYVTATRVSLDSVVCAFLRGQSAESICQSFAPLTLEQVYGAIAFYLANREAIDQCLQQGRVELEALRQEARRRSPLLHAKLDAAKRESSAYVLGVQVP